MKKKPATPKERRVSRKGLSQQYDISPEHADMLKRFDLTPDEAADILHVSVVTMYRKLSSGEIPSWRTGEGKTSKIFVRGSDLSTYMTEKQGRRVPAL